VACTDKQLTPATAQTLQQLGISLGLYATANLVLMLIWACTWFVVGAIIAWRKSNDWMALLVAFWLVLQGTTNATLTVGDSQSSWYWLAFFFNTLAFLFLDLVSVLSFDVFLVRWRYHHYYRPDIPLSSCFHRCPTATDEMGGICTHNDTCL
jgi:hypothetical protein